MTLIVYGSPLSSNAQKVRFLLAELELAYESHDVAMFGIGTRSPEYLAINPFGLLPTLIDNDPPQIRQEECPPLLSVPAGYYAAIVADVPRRRIIHLDQTGISVLQVPIDDSTTEGMQWCGPFTPPDWTAAVTDLAGNFSGIRAVHRPELGPGGQTFILGNISSRFCRLRWPG